MTSARFDCFAVFLDVYLDVGNMHALTRTCMLHVIVYLFLRAR